ncbi:histidine kinase, partial [Salmonella enterica]|uniref:histidine kinase n=1 Tax=Salmonella enterica TaxID=28901 RepID=UPI003CF1E980
ELHDELGQRLLALKLDLAHLSQSLGDPVARSSLGAADRHLSELVDAVRRLSTDLRPAVLDDLGLEAAAQALAQDFERNT